MTGTTASEPEEKAGTAETTELPANPPQGAAFAVVGIGASAGILQLKPRGEARGPHLPVDAFFKSLAEDRQTAAIGVILSGTGSDGTLGVEDIKAAGGITFAQDEESAKYPGMPQSPSARTA